MFTTTKRRLRRNSGFTLTEVIGSLALLSIALPAIAFMFGNSLGVDSDVNSSTQAYFLANSLMNEISQRRFWQSPNAPGNGPDAGEVSGYDRRNFNDIDDYNQFKISWGALTPPRDETGAAMTLFPKFSQYVTVVNIAAPTAAGGTRSMASVSDGTTDFKLVTVTIAWQNGKKNFSLNKVFARP